MRLDDSAHFARGGSEFVRENLQGRFGFQYQRLVPHLDDSRIRPPGRRDTEKLSRAPAFGEGLECRISRCGSSEGGFAVALSEKPVPCLRLATREVEDRHQHVE